MNLVAASDVEIISDLELGHIIGSLRPCGLEEIGSKDWVGQMSMLEELNVQLALEAERGAEERVKDAMVEADKLKLVVREAMLIELWRDEIMPRILRLGEPKSSFQVCSIFYVFVSSQALLTLSPSVLYDAVQ